MRTFPFSESRDIGSARMTLPRDAVTSLILIRLLSRLPSWKGRSAACLTTSETIAPP
jgi:hypothetical protein